MTAALLTGDQIIALIGVVGVLAVLALMSLREK